MRDPQTELLDLEEQNLRRTLRRVTPAASPLISVGKKDYLNFSSNDYLGLSRHPALIVAAQCALQTHGAGATASRLITGSLDLHHQLEDALAHAKKAEAALTFANGYTTALGTLTALAGKDDTLILDKLCHASLIDAARLSGATLRIYPHNDLNKLEKILLSTRQKATAQSRIIVVTESVFSMDGDVAPLQEIVTLKNQYGALLMVDEAHAFGILGPTGLGLAEELGLQAQIDLQMGTLGKALGSAGGYLAASRSLIDLLINKSRSFIYSTAPPPAQIAASHAALNLIQTEEGHQLRRHLHQNISQLLSSPFFKSSAPHPTPIIPLILGENQIALDASTRLQEAGFLIPAIRYPTVPRDTARLRLTLTAAHTTEHIQQLIDGIAEI